MDPTQPQNLNTPVSPQVQNTSVNVGPASSSQVATSPVPPFSSEKKKFFSHTLLFIGLILLTLIITGVLLYFAVNNKTITSNRPATDTKKMAVVNPSPTPKVSYLVSQYSNPFSEKIASLYINPFSEYINPFKLTSILRSEKIKYPVSALSECSRPKECREFCSVYENKSKCESFASTNNIYKKPIIDFNNLTIKQSIEKDLGCSSSNSCLDLCNKEENYQKCTDFAQKNNVPGGKQLTDNYSIILSKAKETLNCTSLDTCKTFCEKEENRSTCTDFSNEIGLGAGLTKVGPDGCNTEELCSRFCLYNKSVCEQFRKDNSL